MKININNLFGNKVIMPIIDVMSNSVFALCLVMLCFVGLNSIYNSFNLTNTKLLSFVVSSLTSWLVFLITLSSGLFLTTLFAGLLSKNNHIHITSKLYASSFYLTSVAAGICIVDLLFIVMCYYNNLQFWVLGLITAIFILYQTGKRFYSNFGRAILYIGKKFYRKARREWHGSGASVRNANT